MTSAGRRLAPLLVALAVASCGGDGGSERAAAPPTAQPVGPQSQGSSVQYASCGDWKRGSVAEKEATVVALRGQLTPQSSADAASDLTDTRAVALLDHACKESFASSLRLYKLYVRAQAFAPLAE